MKNIKCFILFALNLAFGSAVAQEAVLVSSTRQDWSGGIAGRHGSSCSFTVEMYDCRKSLVPDSLWIDGARIPLNEQNGNVTMTRRGDTVCFNIRVTISKDAYVDTCYPEKESKVVKPPFNYAGVALLSYTYKGRQRYFVIDKIMNYLPHIAYP